MSKLYVTEFIAEGRDHGVGVPIADTGTWVENTNSPLSISGVSANTAAFASNTTIIRVHTDVVCSVLITQTGINATTSNARLAANQTEYFAVRGGWFLSVIANT